MDNSKKNNKNQNKTGASYTNDQLGENEIDKDSADKYRGDNKKKKK